MSDHTPESAWRAFWNRGGWWRALIVAGVYLGLYLGAGWLIGTLFGSAINVENIFATPESVFVALTLPLIIGAIALTGFVLSVGWFKPLFAKQPIAGKWWMWAGPVVVALPVLLRFFGINYSEYQLSVVALSLFTGLFIGFVEEVLTRGIVVKMMRDAGKSEWVVMVVSSLLFSLLHASNLLSGQPVLTVALTMVYTFGFGICMYLTLRATGNLLWPILLHGMYDPTLFLATGGIDAGTTAHQSPLLLLAAPANFVIIFVGIVGLIFVRGRVQSKESLTAGSFGSTSGPELR